MLDVLRDLAAGWRREAALLRRYGAEPQAAACEAHAAALEAALRTWELEELTLDEAAEEAGLAPDTIGRKLRSGELPNAGEKGRPRVRRCDLHPALRQARLRVHRSPVDDLVADA